MKCPMCVEEGKKSTVTSDGCTVTLMCSAPYYDEEGMYHDHDPNKRSEGLYCSNGHRFGRIGYKKCPAKGCDYGGGYEVRVYEQRSPARSY